MRKETKLLFDSLGILEDVWELLRQSAPFHKFDKVQKQELSAKLDKLKNNADELKRLLS